MKIFTVAFTSVVVAILAVVLGFRYYHSSTPYPHAEDIWWGKDDQEQISQKSEVILEQMEPIHFADEMLEDLKQRLTNARFFESFQGSNWQYGGNVEDLKRIVKYWRDEFDWRKQEDELNSFKHFTAKIDGIKVHYVHVKPANKNTKVIPILLLHGWPGSFYEFYKLIPLLTNSNRDLSFEVICPSLPGFTLSEAPSKPGMDPIQIARLFTKLMDALGFKLYYIQGGDWGSVIGRTMAVVNPSHVRGIHVNMFVPVPPYGIFSIIYSHFFPTKGINKFEPLKQFYFIISESGYFHIQATKPDSLGFALNDSPVGLAAYVLEKFFAWSGCKQNDSFLCVENRFTKDELLTNVMLFWLTGSMPTAMRIYKENKFSNRATAYPVSVPTAMAQFADDPLVYPKSWLEIPYPNTVQFSNIPRGGHFAALEEPQLLADDIWKFVTKVEHDTHNA